jgi:hypothetical protein
MGIIANTVKELTRGVDITNGIGANSFDLIS